MVRPRRAAVHAGRSGQVAHQGRNDARRRRGRRGTMAGDVPGRAGHGAVLQVDGEAVLGEAAGRVAGRRAFRDDGEPLLLQARAGGRVAVGGVADDVGLVSTRRRSSPSSSPAASRSGVFAAVAATSSISSESGSTDRCALYPSKRRLRDLCPCRAWVSTVEITRSGAVLRAIRNTPSPPCSTSCPATRASRSAASPAASASGCPSSDAQRGQRVFDQLVDQRLAGGGVVPVTRRLARPWRNRHRGAAPARTARPAGCRPCPSAASTLRIADRSWVTVSWVATAS